MLDWHDYAIGDHRITCPNCGRGKRDKVAGLKVEHDRAVLHCFRCGLIETYRDKSTTAYRKTPSIQPERTQVQQHTTLSDWGRALWAQTRELSDVAVDYLQHRKCVIPPVYGALRWHPALKHPGGHVGPALVAMISSIDGNTPLSLHRTWITATGKADVNPPRMLLAGHQIRAGVIKLWEDADVGHTLGLAEGIESALSLAHSVQPAWACIDAGHLGEFPLMTGITRVYIAQDADPAGRKAAATCAARYHAAGSRVEVTEQHIGDINNVVTEAAHG